MNSLRITKIVTSILLLLLFIPLIQELFAQLGLTLFGEALYEDNPWLRTIFTHGILLVLVMLYFLAQLEPLREWGFVYKKQLLLTSTAIGVLAAITLFFVDNQEGLFAAYNVPTNPTLLVAIGFLFTWGILGPLAEELLFRGALQTTLTRYTTKPWIPILVTVVCEVALHAGLFYAGIKNVPMLLYVAVLATIACWVYYRTKSLLGPFIIHALGNAGELLLYWIFL
ncbi:MAG: lysostaphin resistance A-like protein [Candidatus Woesearchaeota archaeon]